MRPESDIYQALLEAIDRGDFSPGDRLVETELAERFGVSRTPIREALNRLDSHGLVVRDPRRGMTVAELDHDQLGELYQLREVLEGFAARLAARHAAPAEIDVLREMLEADRLHSNDTRALAISNRRFHRQIHRASRNRYLNQMLQTMRRSLALLSGTTLAVRGRGEESLNEHEAILTAIEQRDEDAAEAATRRHIVNAYKTRIRFEANED